MSCMLKPIQRPSWFCNNIFVNERKTRFPLSSMKMRVLSHPMIDCYNCVTLAATAVTLGGTSSSKMPFYYLNFWCGSKQSVVNNLKPIFGTCSKRVRTWAGLPRTELPFIPCLSCSLFIWHNGVNYNGDGVSYIAVSPMIEWSKQSRLTCGYHYLSFKLKALSQLKWKKEEVTNLQCVI